MADITIVNGAYKPTYNWGAPPCKPLCPVGFPIILPSGGLGEWYEAGKLLQAFVGSDLDFI